MKALAIVLKKYFAFIPLLGLLFGCSGNVGDEDLKGTFFPNPSIDSISPSSGSLSGGTSVTIQGNNFHKDAQAYVGDSVCTQTIFVSSDQITCITPVHPTGTVNVTVKNSATRTATLASAFTFGGTPSITSISPTQGATYGGTLVTLTGTNFLSGGTITVGGTSCSSVNVISTTSAQCLTSSHAAGTTDVVFTNSDAQSGTLANGFQFVVSSLQLSGISPAGGLEVNNGVLSLDSTGFLSEETIVKALLDD